MSSSVVPVEGSPCKTPERVGSEGFLVGEYMAVVGEWRVGGRGGIEDPHPFPTPFPVHLSHLAVPFTVNWQSSK